MNTQFSTTPLPYLRRFAGLFALILPICLALAQGTPVAPPVVYTSTDFSANVTAGPIVNLKQLASESPGPAGSAGGENHFNRFPKLLPPMQDTGETAPQLPATPLATLPEIPDSSFRGFIGLTHLDQRLYAGGGNQFSTEPPDQGLAVGNGFVLEGVNAAINVYDTNGIVQLPRPVSLDELFGLPPAINRTTGEFGVFAGDVSCLFDPETQRWFVMAWAQLNTRNGTPLRQSRLYLAVSQTDDPRGAYATYTFNTTSANAPDGNGPRIPDFPHFAVDRYGLFVNWQEFKINPDGSFDGYIGTAILAVSKTALINNGGGRPPRRLELFRIPFSDTGFAFRVWPAYIPPGQTPVLSNGGTEYFASSNVFGNSGHHIAIWALTNTSSLDTPTPNLDLSRTVVSTQGYVFPNFGVPQKNGFHPLGASLGEPVEDLDAGNDTISSAEYVNGNLWATLSSAMRDDNGNNIEVVEYFAFTPQITNGNLTASLFTQGVIGRSGLFLMYPAIAINTDGNGVIEFSVSGRNNFPSSGFVSLTGTTVSSINIARAGNLPEDGFSGYPEFGGNGIARWGDYSAAAVDNIDNALWMATEFIPDLNRTALANWATYVTRFQP